MTPPGTNIRAKNRLSQLPYSQGTLVTLPWPPLPTYRCPRGHPCPRHTGYNVRAKSGYQSYPTSPTPVTLPTLSWLPYPGTLRLPYPGHARHHVHAKQATRVTLPDRHLLPHQRRRGYPAHTTQGAMFTTSPTSQSPYLTDTCYPTHSAEVTLPRGPAVTLPWTPTSTCRHHSGYPTHTIFVTLSWHPPVTLPWPHPVQRSCQTGYQSLPYLIDTCYPTNAVGVTLP
jgi:hypothetical protein